MLIKSFSLGLDINMYFNCVVLLFLFISSCQRVNAQVQPVRCESLMDLIIVLDSSGSIGQTSFDQAKDAMATLASNLNIGPKKFIFQ